MIKQIFNKFTKSFVITSVILAWVGSAFAFKALIVSDLTWSAANFDAGSYFTQNMLLSEKLWYTCRNTTCSEKVYWRKFNTNAYTLRDAVNLCWSYGMTVPLEPVFYYMYAQNFNWIDSTSTYGPFRAMNNGANRHWSMTKHDGPSWNWFYYSIAYPSNYSWTYAWWSNSYQVVCVYKN